MHIRAAASIRLAVLLGLLWFGLSGNRGWAFGVPAILAALLIGQMIAPLQAIRVSPRGLARFLGYFVQRSLLGGLDVAWRALSPRLPLEVAWHRHRFRLPPGPPRTVFVGVVSLLPGTLATRLDNDDLWLHSIAGGPAPEVARLEERVAELFGVAGGATGMERSPDE